MDIQTVERQLKKIPSVKEVNIAPPPSDYEAFIYKWTNQNTGRKYLGSHKGEIGDNYLDSSTSNQFKKDRASSQGNFKFEIIEYGDYEEIKTKETSILKKVNAAKSKDWYNKHNGGKGKQTYRIHKIKELIKGIQSGEFEVSIEPIDDIYPLAKLQVREEQLNTALVREIKERIDDKAGNTDLCEPILIYESRVKGKDVIGNGNHTVTGAYQSKHAVDIPVMRIPLEIHEEYSNIELRMVSNLMNKKDEVVREAASTKDAEKQLLAVYVNSGLPANDPSNIELLEEMGFTNNQIKKTIIPNATEAIEEKRLEMANQIFVKYDTNSPFHDRLQDTVDELKDSKTFSCSYSSEFVKLAEIQKKFRLAKQLKPNLKHIKIVIHHPKPSSVDKWKTDKLLHQDEINYWFLTHPDVDSFEWVIMPHLTENSLVN